MNRNSTRNTGLALLGLLALVVYILACTSFSPDDKQVLYPAFDANGALGLAVYDRETRQSEMLFVPAFYRGNHTNAERCIVRGRWLPDGHHIAVAWAGTEDDPDAQLHLAVMPTGGSGTLKVFSIGAIKEPRLALTQPLALVGDNLLVMVEEKEVLRLNLRTGTAVRYEFPEIKGDLALYPSPESEAVYYIQGGKGHENAVFGRLDTDRFALTPMATITNQIADGSFFAFDRHGSRVAFVETSASNKVELVVLKNGAPELRKPLPFTDHDVNFGNAVFAGSGDVCYASFRRQSQTNQADLGLMEIPLHASGNVREVVLVHRLPGTDDAQALYFQVGLSHDGKTAALASTLLALEKEQPDLGPMQCALFLVDLSSPDWKVTSVPIPLPARPAGK